VSTHADKRGTQGHRGGDAVAVAMLLSMQSPGKVLQASRSLVDSAEVTTTDTANSQKVQQVSSEVVGHETRTGSADSCTSEKSFSNLPPARTSKGNNFLSALYKMCNCDGNAQCMKWAEDGRSFWVANMDQVGAFPNVSRPLPCASLSVPSLDQPEI
jgi:hypothetical protein